MEAPYIIYPARKSTKRFGELRRLMPEITQGVLTQQLRELEKDSLVSHVVYQEVPPRVEYSLSAHGQTLENVLRDMCAWGFTHEEFLEKEKDPLEVCNK